MKKLLLLVMSVLLLSSGMSYAGILDSVKYYGEGSFYGASAQTRGVYTSGTGFYGILGIKANVYENISAAVALGYTKLWGDFSGSYAFGGAPINDNNGGLLNNLKIVEANVTFDKLFDIEGLKIKIGRQFYGDKDSTVLFFGVRNDNPTLMNYKASLTLMQPITSIDAVTAYYETEHIKANAIFATLRNASISNAKNTNSTIRGFDFKYVNIANMIDAQAYFYDAENAASLLGGVGRHYDMLGLKGTFHKTISENELKASLEIGRNFEGAKVLSDENPKRTNFIKLDASFDIKNINLTPRASFGLFGGWDKYNGDKSFSCFGNYYPGLIGYPGRAGGESFTDAQIFNIGADYAYKKFTFGLDYFNFSPRDYDGAGAKSLKFNEIDITAKYAYTENVYFNLGIGHLFADNSDNDIAYYQAGISYKL